MVDPDRYGGVAAIAKRQLRSTLLHEFHHLARESQTTNSNSIMERVIDEGLATAFERDFGDAPTPWGTYSPEVADWAKELLACRPTLHGPLGCLVIQTEGAGSVTKSERIS